MEIKATFVSPPKTDVAVVFFSFPVLMQVVVSLLSMSSASSLELLQDNANSIFTSKLNVWVCLAAMKIVCVCVCAVHLLLDDIYLRQAHAACADVNGTLSCKVIHLSSCLVKRSWL